MYIGQSWKNMDKYMVQPDKRKNTLKQRALSAPHYRSPYSYLRTAGCFEANGNFGDGGSYCFTNITWFTNMSKCITASPFLQKPLPNKIPSHFSYVLNIYIYIHIYIYMYICISHLMTPGDLPMPYGWNQGAPLKGGCIQGYLREFLASSLVE